MSRTENWLTWEARGLRKLMKAINSDDLMSTFGLTVIFVKQCSWKINMINLMERNILQGVKNAILQKRELYLKPF